MQASNHDKFEANWYTCTAILAIVELRCIVCILLNYHLHPKLDIPKQSNIKDFAVNPFCYNANDVVFSHFNGSINSSTIQQPTPNYFYIS